MAYEKVLEFGMEMVVKVKIVRLGKVTANLQKDNEELRARAVTITLPEKLAKRRNAIKDDATEIKELEKVTQLIMKEKTQYWGISVHEKQLHQLNVHLNEEKFQLTMLKGSLKIIHPLSQVTKAAELK